MLSIATASGAEIREYIRVRGQVQGVGFRPFVYRLATELGLAGWVRNDAQGVEIEVQGDTRAVHKLLRQLALQSPPLARVDSIEHQLRACRTRATAFLIQASGEGRVGTAVTPDAAVCANCLSELFDPSDRRYRYPFINCTYCGPRYTITTRLPYDRCNTSMAGFTLCRDCRLEYDNPHERRFHAQPNACPSCGPELTFYDVQGNICVANDIIAAAVDRIQAGDILAVKGLGGFHLVCDAQNAETVARLRARKQREEKPFAVMAANMRSIVPRVQCGSEEQQLLDSVERPIVLLRKRQGCDIAFEGIAPGIAWLGVMLPYTPLHYLLFHEAAGRPKGTTWLYQPQDLVLVMTSANPGGEPLVIDNQEAFRRLSGIADGFVMHDREICLHCDDSVMRWNGQAPGFLRRGRGYTPRAIKLARSGPAVLALGGWYKNTVCLTRGDEAFISQHIGDLDNVATCDALTRVVTHMMQVLEITPQRVAHDLHPDFFSTRFAAQLAHAHGIPTIGVQHHHAHIAAVMAEHALPGPVLGVALDGVGLGDDGGLWGGELLCVEEDRYERLAHLMPLALPGGDRAAREPWRMAAGALYALGRDHEISKRFPRYATSTLKQMLANGTNCPTTSSAGRLFDAAAGLLGVKTIIRFEAQAAMLLEGLAECHGPVQPYADGYVIESNGALNLLPLLARLADIRDAGFGAALFHATLAQGLAEWILQAAAKRGLHQVVLGGGCFLNRILSESLRTTLSATAMQVFETRQLPPNDGGLSLGQAWVARNCNGGER